MAPVSVTYSRIQSTQETSQLSTEELLAAAVPVNKDYQTVTIPAVYADLDKGPAPGVIAGIVLGSVAGFLLLSYFLYISCGGSELPVYRFEVGYRGRRSSSRRRSRSREVREIVRPRRSRSGRLHRGGRREVLVVDESVTSASRTGDGGDVVEVIEEHSPTRRSSRRH